MNNEVILWKIITDSRMEWTRHGHLHTRCVVDSTQWIIPLIPGREWQGLVIDICTLIHFNPGAAQRLSWVDCYARGSGISGTTYEAWLMKNVWFHPEPASARPWRVTACYIHRDCCVMNLMVYTNNVIMRIRTFHLMFDWDCTSIITYDETWWIILVYWWNCFNKS
jgi:hypothetical protein